MCHALKSALFWADNPSPLPRFHCQEGMANSNGLGAVANCYVFKSRLQEYAQKAGIPTPVYDTIREGPSHEPTFRSSVTVNNVRYDSLPGFFNRKTAEQSAAEVALLEVLKSGSTGECLPQPVHETGLCKNLLQEYSQKMNYAIPSYSSIKQPHVKMSYLCTVDVGGVQYIGATASTKKEAEIKAARTALLAIRSNPCDGPGAKTNGGYQYSVVPIKKKGVEEQRSEPVNSLKPKKTKFKKWAKKKFLRKKDYQTNINNGHVEDGTQAGEIANLDEVKNVGNAESSGVRVDSHFVQMEESNVGGISVVQLNGGS